jgi:hypothetical protein
MTRVPRYAAGRCFYVGGKSGSVRQLRNIVEKLDGSLLHHDGGQTQNTALLAGLVGQADCVFFPVDFVSHQAMYAVKRYCALKQVPFVALHRAGVASLMSGIQEFLRRIAGAAELAASLKR